MTTPSDKPLSLPLPYFYLQVHCPLGQAQELPQEQLQPGAMALLLLLLKEGLIEERRLCGVRE